MAGSNGNGIEETYIGVGLSESQKKDLNNVLTSTQNGVYVSTKATQKNVSEVRSTWEQSKIDESYVKIDDKSFRPEFSDLKNTYMISANGHKARENFWGKSEQHKYNNGDYNIEDPLFTGFTLSIDRLNSPLFYTIGKYDGVASGRFFGEYNQGSTLSRNIADEIENCIKINYGNMILSSLNSYDIVAALTKDKFNVNDEIGYGLQHNVYLDGLPYGATEYIYMVDKKVDNTPSAQDNSGGHMMVGDGNATKSVQLSALKESATKEMNDLKSKLDAATELRDANPNDKTEYESYNTAYKNSVAAYANKTAPQNKANEGKKTRGDELDEEIASLSDTTLYSSRVIHTIESELNDLMVQIDNESKKLAVDGDTTSKLTKDEYDTVCKNIDELDKKLTEIISKYNGKPEEAQKKTGGTDEPYGVDKKTAEVKSCKITFGDVTVDEKYKKLPITNETDKTYDAYDAYKKAAKYKEIKIDCEVKLGEDREKLIAEKKENRQKYDEEVGAIQTSMDEAVNNMKNSNYVKNTSEVDLLESEYASAQAQVNVINGAFDVKNTDEADAYLDKEEINNYGVLEGYIQKDAAMFTGDKADLVDDDFTKQNTNKKKLPSAPQTVYDILGFISGMIRLTTEYPYLLQSITGLDEAYKNNYVVKDSFRGSGDNKISISIYESVDLKISSMFNKYFNAVYDAQYRRERVPVNLRRFNCSVFVHDIRNFLSMSTSLGRQLKNKSTDNIPKIVEIALNSLSAIEFKFYGCEIVAEETGSVFDNVSNAEMGDMRMTNFVFTYSDCVINFLPFEDLYNASLKSISHRPKVSVNNGTNKDLKDLKYSNSEKAYNMNSKEFDKSKPSLNTKENVYDSKQDEKTKKSLNVDYSIDYDNIHELEGLGGERKTAPQPSDYKTIKNNHRLESPLGNVRDNDYATETFNLVFSEQPQLKGIAESHDTGKYPVEYPTTPEEIKNFKLGSRLGNVNDNDRYENKSTKDYNIKSDTTPYPKSYPRTPSQIENFTLDSPLGNVNDDDMDEYYNMIDGDTEGNVRYNESKVNAIKEKSVLHGSLDRSPLGNVNNDDRYERSELNANRDRYTRKSDIEKERIANMNADIYADENYHYSQESLESIFTRIATSVSASTGMSTANVFENYLSELENIITPDNTVRTVTEIRHSTTKDSENNILKTDVAQLDGIDAKSVGGIVYKIGDVDDNDKLEDKPNSNYHIRNIQGINVKTSNNTIQSIGNVLGKEIKGKKIRYIDDVIPDDVANSTLDYIDNVYPESYPRKNVDYIDDVIPDDDERKNVESLHNVYPQEQKNKNIDYIDDVIPDEKQGKNVKEIDNVYPKETKNIKTVSDLGDVIEDAKINKMIMKLDKLYDKIK